MRVYLIDGTYELFRHYFALPPSKDEHGAEVAAVIGVVRSVLGLLAEGVTHLGVATDHVVESFRNGLWSGYKTSEGVAADLLGQFQVLEDALTSLGIVVWPMVEFEADDALASAAREASAYAEQVVICTPDKDLAQCVVGDLVVQLNRRTGKILDDEGVVGKFGVRPSSIPDYLALVGDSADGFPGLPGWGARSAATVLARFGHIENIPPKASQWELPLRGAPVLAGTLDQQRDLAMLFKDLATLRTTVKVRAAADRLQWSGPRNSFKRIAGELGAPELFDRAGEIRAKAQR
ncbi:MAG: flap endonuclease [Chloroflexota bacterium]|nr:flap endonuclease [Chloroflexota bacterium]